MQFLRKRRFGSTLRKFFDRIYCINLDDRPDRWRYVSRHLSEFGLSAKVQRFPAIDVRNDPRLKVHERLLRNNFSLLAMCGCMLSHRSVIAAAKQDRLDNVLVFEDDIRVLEANIGNLHYALAALGKRDWDVFYLGATYLWELKPEGSFLVNVPNGAYATHAIAYHHTVFDRILELLPSDPMEFLLSSRFEINALDKWLQSDLFDHTRFFGSNPIMVVQGLQESDIAFNQQPGIEQRQIALFEKNLAAS